MKKLLFVLIFVFAIFPVFAEEVEITTYYPAPEGVYGELTSKVYYDYDDPAYQAGSADYFLDPYPPPGDPRALTVAGDVGIGTSAPSDSLHIKGSFPRIRLEKVPSGMPFSASILFTHEVATGSGADGLISVGIVGGDPYDFLIQNRVYGKKIVFQTCNNPSAPEFTEVMNITSDSRVGIGTPSPQGKLEVSHDNGTTHDLMVNSTTGNVGIGTTTPNASLQVNGAISRQGTTLRGATSYEGIPTQVNLGVGSITGLDGQTLSYCTISGGKENSATSGYSTVSGGIHNTVSGDTSTISGGGYNTVSGNRSVISGGLENTADGSWSTISGGTNNTASGDCSTVLGGSGNTASGSYSTAIGTGVTASGLQSIAMGYFVTASNSNSVVIGSGIAPSGPLNNTLANSLMIGFNSNIPTLFVGPSSGTGTFGNVGIGTTTPPSKLAVVGLPSSGGSYTLRYDPTSGLFSYSISSLRYKDNVQILKDDFYKILNVTPKSFTYKNTGISDVGYIAEDLDEIGLKNLVIYDKDGQPDSIKYDQISLYVLEIVKEQQKEIESLKQEITDLKSKVK